MNDPETLHAGRHLHLAKRDGWEYATRPNATGVVAVVAVTDAGELVLVRQRRPVVGREVLELPAGLAGDDGDAGESLLTAAKRELEEETGHAAASWRRLLTGYPSAGLTDEAVTFFHATGLTRTGAGGGVGGEDIAVELVPLAGLGKALTEAAEAGVGVDLKVPAGVALLRG